MDATAAAVRGQRNRVTRQITISFQLGQHGARHRNLDIHVRTIGTIRNTLNDRDGLVDTPVYDYPDEGDESYEADGADPDIEDGYGELAWPTDRRWRPVTAFAGVVVALGSIATAVVINSGDSASTRATVGAPTPRTVMTTPSQAPSTARPTVPPSATLRPSRTPQLPPETVTTVPPSTYPSTEPSIGPTKTATAAPPPTSLPPSATLNPRTVVYTVSGSKQLFDLVTVVYTDARGFPQTEFNVALPWTKAVVLNPGVQTESVIATSFYSRLDCAVLNAAGQPVLASANNSVIATCTR